ncbi:hypothetical protein N9089_05065 [Crocinitomicaceae bacterium]|nr:hypothetical protein [Crocinitomicaceae bacterium]
MGSAVICLVLTVTRMIFSFQAVAQASSTPKAKDLAEGISNALIPAYGVIPFAILGIALVIAGLAVRRPIEE